MRCANHVDRPAVGVCVSCRKVVCGACTTRLQGRNFCVECLERRAAARPTDSPRDSSSASRAGVVFLTATSVMALVGSLCGVGFLLYLVG
jgi:hypothetical protein